MAEKTKKVSITAFEKAIDSVYEPTTTVEWNGVEIVIKKNLTLSDAISFVDACVRSCFDENDGTYCPEVRDLTFYTSTILFYTNITMPSNIEKLYDMIYRSGIIGVIENNIDAVQYEDITTAIDRKIRYLLRTNINNVMKQANEISSALDEAQLMVAKSFGDMSDEDVKNIVSAFSDGVIDENKLAKAILESKKNEAE